MDNPSCKNCGHYNAVLNGICRDCGQAHDPDDWRSRHLPTCPSITSHPTCLCACPPPPIEETEQNT